MNERKKEKNHQILSFFLKNANKIFLKVNFFSKCEKDRKYI